jgi:hypothetical protein
MMAIAIDADGDLDYTTVIFTCDHPDWHGKSIHNISLGGDIQIPGAAHVFS